MLRLITLPFVLIFSTQILAQNTDSVPLYVNLKPYLTAVKDQDNRNLCSYFATTAILEAEIKREYGKEVNLSEQYMNYLVKINHIGDNPFSEESSCAHNLMAVQQGGLLYESDMPYCLTWFNAGFPCAAEKQNDTHSNPNCYSQNPPSKEALARTFNPDFDFRANSMVDHSKIIKLISKYKRPLVFAFPITYNAPNNWTESGRIFYSDALDSLDKSNGQTRSWHIAVISGYDIKKQVLLVRNSYGISWGDSGYGYLSFQDFDKYGSHDVLYCKLKNDSVPLPEEKMFLTPKIENFSLKNKITKTHNIEITMQGKISQFNLRPVTVRSCLIALPKGTNPNKLDTIPAVLELDSAVRETYHDVSVRAVYAFIPEQENSQLIWDKNNPLKLTIPAGMVSSKSVQNALNNSEVNIYLMTSVYVVDDKNGKIKLVRKFILMDKKKLK